MIYGTCCQPSKDEPNSFDMFGAFALDKLNPANRAKAPRIAEVADF
jgi:hypothetical protein